MGGLAIGWPWFGGGLSASEVEVYTRCGHDTFVRPIHAIHPRHTRDTPALHTRYILDTHATHTRYLFFETANFEAEGGVADFLQACREMQMHEVCWT
jgi:hypothetical protein